MTNPASAVSPASFSRFGDLLRYLRKRAELSQRKLALHVGYHHSYLGRIENNEYIPDATTLMARFVPALDLEKEPAWTRRLLELAASDEERSAAPAESKPASFDPVPDPAIPELDPPPSLFPISLPRCSVVKTRSQRWWGRSPARTCVSLRWSVRPRLDVR